MDPDNEQFEDALDEISDESPQTEIQHLNVKDESVKKLSKREKSVKRGDFNDNSHQVSLSESLEEAHLSAEMFLNNRFEEARNIVKPMSDRSIYHSLGYSILIYLKAMMTTEEKNVEEASEVLTKACETIDQFRRKTGIVGRILSSTSNKRSSIYNSWTETEVHAELCYAEVLLLKAALTMHEDETLVSFVKAGLKVRACYQSFRECWAILNERDWSDATNKHDFESGVRLGVGTFNLMISMLPARVMRLLEFVGFGGNRESGISEIKKVYESRLGLRQFLASIVLLGYNLNVLFSVGNASECDLPLCLQILNENLEKYPKGAIFMMFKGRMLFVQGKIEEAKQWFKASAESQDELPQFHHICYWELFRSCQYSREWKLALFYADKLFQGSKWSKCFYAYQKAAMMCMLEKDLTAEQKREQIELMRTLPTWKKRVAGKSLPIEKFAIRKAERFLDQGYRLTLPSLELIYIWNGFPTLETSWNLMEPIYVLVENELKKTGNDSNKYFVDDYCLLTLLQGMCLKHMRSPLQAEECFLDVMGYKGKLKSDTYLVPFAMVEYGLILKDQGHLEKANTYFEKAKNDFKGYSFQSRLHFRIHAAQSSIKKVSRSLSTADVNALMPSLVESGEFNVARTEKETD